MKKIFALVLYIFLVSGFHSLWAWGRDGHEIVATAAQAQLTDKTIAAINDLRKQQISIADLNTGEKLPPFKYIDTNIPLFFSNADLDLSLIANWADGWRGSHATTANWHFIDLDVTKDIKKSDESSYCQNSDCNVEQIPINLKILGDVTQPALDRIKALFFVIHFVGDIHQPLHCANDNDRGGNQKNVKFFNKTYNLHHIWDDNIIAQQGKSVKDIAGGISVTAAQRTAWTQGDTGDWALESYLIAKNKIYANYPTDGSIPAYGQSYEDTMWPVVQEQLTKASVRLAYLLNMTLGGEEATPIAVKTPTKPKKIVTPSKTPKPSKTPSASTGHVKVIKPTAKVYSEASSKSSVLKRVNQNDVFELVDPGKDGKYYKISLGEKVGYIYEKNVEVQ